MTRRGLLLAPLVNKAPRKKRVAAIVTEYRHYSHADVVVGRLLGGCSPNGKHRPNRTQVVSLYTHQNPKNQDMSPDLAARFGFRLAKSIPEAIAGAEAVVFIGEHGNYPTNELGQKLYPRFELFSEILDVYEKNGRGLPTFFDKHLSYSFDKAQAMFRRVRKLGFPFLCGSSIPVTVRFPEIDVPLDTPVTGAVAIAYGDIDAYGFHTLEALQSLIERRRGGETGIASVEMVTGANIVSHMQDRDLWEACWARQVDAKGSAFDGGDALFLLTYKDGLKAGVLMTRRCQHWTAAVRTNTNILATRFGGPEIARPLPHFDGLVDCIEEMFISGKEPYPPERTLLTTGALSLLFESKRTGNVVATPQLAVAYKAPRDVYRQRS